MGVGYVFRVRLASFFAGAACASAFGLYVLHGDYQASHHILSQQAKELYSSLDGRISELEKLKQNVASSDQQHPTEQALGKAYNELKQGEPAIERLFELTMFCPQALFAGTIAENVGYGNVLNTIDMKKVEQAAKLANADEFIRRLPQGYSTNVGQRGSCLSGGQRQRLAIARAIYQESSILVLDEATSALDNKSESLVREALEHLMVNHTIMDMMDSWSSEKMAAEVVKI